MATSEATKSRVREFIFNRPGEYLATESIAKMFGTTSPVVKAQFGRVADDYGGHIDAIKGRGFAYIPAKKQLTVEEQMEQSIKDAVEAFSKNQPEEKPEAAASEWTINDAAEYFGVSDEAVRRWVTSGKLRAMKSNRAWRILPEDIESFEATHKVQHHKKQTPVPKQEPMPEPVSAPEPEPKMTSNIERELLILRTKVEIYEKIIFGKETRQYVQN